MRRSLWSLVLCAGVCVMAWAAARPVGAERASDDRAWPAPVCESAESAESAEPAGLTCGKCGDRYCNPSCGETETTCPRDCGPSTATDLTCGKCGDRYCNPSCGETATTCPKDCAGVPS